jgi:hypothetical protein
MIPVAEHTTEVRTPVQQLCVKQSQSLAGAKDFSASGH